MTNLGEGGTDSRASESFEKRSISSVDLVGVVVSCDCYFDLEPPWEETSGHICE